MMCGTSISYKMEKSGFLFSLQEILMNLLQKITYTAWFMNIYVYYFFSYIMKKVGLWQFISLFSHTGGPIDHSVYRIHYIDP